MSNLILNYLFSKYKKCFSKKDKIFYNEDKPKDKQKPFCIIGVNENCDSINKVHKKLINLIIDFLMFMKDLLSSIIHLEESNNKIQIGILSEYIWKEIETI